MVDAESTSGYSFTAQYGVPRGSVRGEAYRTQFGSVSADAYVTPMISPSPRNNGNVARRLSRNSFLIPPQTFDRRHLFDGRFLFK